MTPDVPYRMEFTFELPGTPEQVWDAIATARGISAWFLPTDLEEREGGAIRVQMGENMSSSGTVTGWDPPRRFAYVEPDWAELAGRDPSSVTPMATEFLIEAQSGGTCVLRVVSSAFGTGADWEQEFFDDAQKYWAPYFDNLRLYLTHFPGQRATTLSVAADLPDDLDTVWSVLRQALGAGEVGQAVEAHGISGQVERIGTPPGPNELLLRVTDPVPGFLGFSAYAKGDGTTAAAIEGYLFSQDAPELVERTKPEWKAWLQSLKVAAA